MVKINLRHLNCTSLIAPLKSKEYSYFYLNRIIERVLRRRFHEFLTAVNENSWTDIASQKLSGVKQLIATLTQSYMQGIHIAQVQKKQVIPVLSIIPSAQVVRKELDSFKEFCAKHQRTVNSKEHAFRLTLKENPKLKQLKACSKVSLSLLLKNHEKTRVWMSLSSWHSYCLFSMLNYMSERLQNQRCEQVDLQMKLMDILAGNGMSLQYSSFVLAVIRSNDTIRIKRIKRMQGVLSGVIAKAEINKKAVAARQHFIKWWSIANKNSKIIETAERKLQLVKLVTKLETGMKRNKAIALERAYENSITKKSKTNIRAMIIKVLIYFPFITNYHQ